MPNSSQQLSDHPFWMAVCEADVDRAKSLLQEDGSLVHRDFRPVEEQDPHTFGFPLVKATDTGSREMMERLLDFGADVDAKSPTEEQRELGGPIMHAFERKRYDLIHFLLDRGASVAAYGWCYPSLVDLVYEKALREGMPKELARHGFDSYLGESSAMPISADAQEATRMFHRLIQMGGQLSLGALVESRYYELAEQLLKTCPERPATIHDYPHGTVFESLCWSASWHGIPVIIDLAMQSCPDRFDRSMAVAVLRGALRSHNRVGLASEYYALVETQLKFLRDHDDIDAVIASDELLPTFYWRPTTFGLAGTEMKMNHRRLRR